MAIELFNIMQAGVLQLVNPIILASPVTTGYTKVNAFDTAIKTDTNIIPNATTWDDMTITKNGWYSLNINLALAGGNGNNFDFELFNNGVATIPAGWVGVLTAGAGNVVSINWSSMFAVTAQPAVVDIRIRRTAGATTVDYYAGNFYIQFWGDL